MDLHKSVSSNNPGKRGLGHLTRASILTLCAGWEVYIEDVFIEVAKFISENVETPHDLPMQLQKALVSFVEKTHLCELASLNLHGENWRTCIVEMAQYEVGILEVGGKNNYFNKPTAERIDRLFQDKLGLDDALSDSWNDKEAINQFVSRRGEIAHLGVRARYVTIRDLRIYLDLIKGTILQSHNHLSSGVSQCTSIEKRIWSRKSSF